MDPTPPAFLQEQWAICQNVKGQEQREYKGDFED